MPYSASALLSFAPSIAVIAASVTKLFNTTGAFIRRGEAAMTRPLRVQGLWVNTAVFVVFCRFRLWKFREQLSVLVAVWL